MIHHRLFEKSHAIESLMLMAVAITLLTSATLAQEQIASLRDRIHPEYDRTFWVTLNQGLNANSMTPGVTVPVKAEVAYHNEKYEAQLTITKLNQSTVVVKMAWFIVDNHYYFPNAALTSVYVDGEPVGMPVQDPEGLDKAARLEMNKLNISGKKASNLKLEADMGKINPQGKQTIYVETASFSKAYQAFVSMWDLGSVAFNKLSGKKSTGLALALPAGKTTMAFTFLGSEKLPDVDTNPPKIVLTPHQR